MTCQTHQAIEMVLHASDVENKAIRDSDAEQKESTAHTVGAQTMTPKHAGNTTTTSPPQQRATFQQATTLEQHHHYSEEQHHQQGHIHNRQVQTPMDFCSRTILTQTNPEPVPLYTHHSTVHHQHHQPT